MEMLRKRKDNSEYEIDRELTGKFAIEKNFEYQEKIENLEEEIRSLELENRAMKVESEELKMWLREKLPLALLKEYMDKFEGVDLKNV